MSQLRTCIMVGPTRTATTSLFRYFARAQGVQGSTRKETNWFLREFVPDLKVPEQTYDECFSPVDGAQARLEASPMYFAFGRRVAERIRATEPDAHIVITLREPVERFFSAWKMINNKRNVALELPPFSADGLLEHCRDASPADVNSYEGINKLALIEGAYGQLLSDWLSVFPREQVHVVFYDWLRDERRHERVRETVFKALGVPASLDHEPLFHENKSRDVRNRFVQRVAVLMNDRFEQFLNRHKQLRDFIRDVYYRFNGTALQRPPAKTVAAVEDYYKDDLALAKSLLEGMGVNDRPAWLK